VLSGHSDTSSVNVKTKGGNLSVSLKVSGKIITDIWLSGPATLVFQGEIEI
jgi:diaminopimelate epimerase